MNPRRIAIAFGIVVAVMIVGSHGQSRPAASADAEKAVLARLADIEAAARALDPDKVFSFVLENDKGSVIQDGRLFRTRDEALESTKQGFRGLQNVSYRFDREYVTMVSPTVALVTSEGSSLATTDSGREISTRFAQTVVLVLTDGGWKVLHAHRSFPQSQ